ncbi:NfeD family protein [Caloramator sp. Dgby_cultured_2]|uniref:NfeD family protein n=1 Tax=Caloramator sp. Dgby_cultured_2 TaxID=3029174 RepID=UPI00237DE726|nr:NfeD family protein [Caloramator sp. Dgby_cultured_2]WDU83152.1 NfeD family protein [Caloramator sp. Dgby_cultured_2]
MFVICLDYNSTFRNIDRYPDKCLSIFAFTIGAIFAIVALIFNASNLIQIIIFSIVSALTLGISYPFIKETLKKTVKRTLRMEEEYIGMELTAEEDIIDKAHIKINGIYWLAKNTGEIIKRGERFKIIGIEGSKFLIQKVRGKNMNIIANVFWC